MSLAYEPLSLEVGGLSIAGIRRRALQPDAPRMLCLHGWLDNAASFVPLMPHLPAVDVVSLDLPGHGHSAHSPDGRYDLVESAYLMRRIIDALGWPDCHIAGHSMGGAIAPLLAVAAPDAVTRLILIEASGPLTEPEDALPARLARAFDDRRSPQRFASRTFQAPARAIEARLNATVMARASAKLIVDRQLLEHDDGWRWRFDPALRYASARYLTEPQVEAVLRAIAVPVLTVVAHEGYLAARPATDTRLACLREHVSVTLPGHHHLHMDTPEPVAAAINRFLGTRPALGG